MKNLEGCLCHLEKKKVKKKVFSVLKKMLFVKKSFHHFLHARLYE